MEDDDDAYDPSDDDSGNESPSDDSDTDSDQEIPSEIVGQDIPPIANQAGGVTANGLPTAPNSSPGSLPIPTVPVVGPARPSRQDLGVASGCANRVSSS